MPLTEKARDLADYLTYAWDSGIIEPYFELVDVTSGHAKTIEILPGLGVLKEDEFQPPPFGTLMELANYHDGELIRISEQRTKTGRKWVVQLNPRLRQSHDIGDTPENVGKGTLDQLPKFFISYKRYEKPFTEKLATYLRRVFGWDNVWYDEGIYAGQKWWNEIVNQLNRSDILVYIVTREAIESVYCRAEFTEAWRLGKQIIPLLMRGAKLSALNDFQYISLPQGELTIAALVEILGAVVQRKAVIPPSVPLDGSWGTRTIQPVAPSGLQMLMKVPASRDPGDSKDKPYCNTGLLLVPGDELVIRTTGKITVDDGQTWYAPSGIIVDATNPGYLSKFHPHEKAYRAVGYPMQGFENTGVVGSLIGWIQNNKSGLENAFFVGDSLVKTVSRNEEGFLHLAVNDTRGAYGDNQEAFDAAIEITHPE